jgi:hypothetical protein
MGSLIRQNELMDTQPSLIRISRKLERWRDQGRKYKVVIDGQIVGAVHNGESRDFTVTKGEHCVRIRIDWSGSRDLVLALDGGQVKTLMCNPKGSAWSSPIRMFSRRGWVDLYETGADDVA